MILYDLASRQYLQENRREYEKRVASVVEQSWLIFSEEADGKEDGSKAETAEWEAGGREEGELEAENNRSQEERGANLSKF